MNKAILDAIENRLTTNKYDVARGITDDQIRELVHLATRAPSSFNLLNWRFIAVPYSRVEGPAPKANVRSTEGDGRSSRLHMCGQLANHESMAARLAPRNS